MYFKVACPPGPADYLSRCIVYSPGQRCVPYVLGDRDPSESGFGLALFALAGSTTKMETKYVTGTNCKSDSETVTLLQVVTATARGASLSLRGPSRGL